MKHLIAVTAAAVLLLVGITSAAAAHTSIVRGTSHADRIHTYNGSQTIYGLGGNDVLRGGRGIDVIYGGRGDDKVWTGSGGAPERAYGGPGNDLINDFKSGESRGYLNGGPGHDVCVGDKHDTFVSCEVIEWRK